MYLPANRAFHKREEGFPAAGLRIGYLTLRRMTSL
jgi:hypothetical protein